MVRIYCLIDRIKLIYCNIEIQTKIVKKYNRLLKEKDQKTESIKFLGKSIDTLESQNTGDLAGNWIADKPDEYLDDMDIGYNNDDNDDDNELCQPSKRRRTIEKDDDDQETEFLTDDHMKELFATEDMELIKRLKNHFVSNQKQRKPIRAKPTTTEPKPKPKPKPKTIVEKKSSKVKSTVATKSKSSGRKLKISGGDDGDDGDDSDDSDDNDRDDGDDNQNDPIDGGNDNDNDSDSDSNSKIDLNALRKITIKNSMKNITENQMIKFTNIYDINDIVSFIFVISNLLFINYNYFKFRFLLKNIFCYYLVIINWNIFKKWLQHIN